MRNRLTRLFIALSESYLFLMSLALGVGLVFSRQAVLLAPFSTIFLQIIFFLTSLKLDPRAVIAESKDIKLLLTANALMLIIFPGTFYLIASLIAPSFAIPLLLLAAMPSGMTSPLLAEVIGGKPGTALVLTITTSLLAPFTIPFVIGIFAKTAVTVSAAAMTWSLVKVIIIPFVLAQVARLLTHERIKAGFFTFKPISLALLSLLIIGSVAKQADVIMQGLGLRLVSQMLVLFAFIAILFAAGYFSAFWRSCEERLTVSVCLTFMNFTLAIYLAGLYFSDPNVLLMSVLVIFPWTLLLLPFKTIVSRYVCVTKSP